MTPTSSQASPCTCCLLSAADLAPCMYRLNRATTCMAEERSVPTCGSESPVGKPLTVHSCLHIDANQRSQHPPGAPCAPGTHPRSPPAPRAAGRGTGIEVSG